MKQTLEEYFKENHKKNIIDYSLRVNMDSGVVAFYIHPCSCDGETLDFTVDDNDLYPIINEF